MYFFYILLDKLTLTGSRLAWLMHYSFSWKKPSKIDYNCISFFNCIIQFFNNNKKQSFHKQLLLFVISRITILFNIHTNRILFYDNNLKYQSCLIKYSKNPIIIIIMCKKNELEEVNSSKIYQYIWVYLTVLIFFWSKKSIKITSHRSEVILSFKHWKQYQYFMYKNRLLHILKVKQYCQKYYTNLAKYTGSFRITVTW